MSPSRSRRLVMGLTLVVIALCACSPPQRPLRVGVLLWPPYELFFVAREHDYFPNDTVELVEYRSPIDVARAYETDGVDAVLITADFALRLAERRPDSRVTLVIDYSNGADAIVARPDVASLEDLRGRPVGVELSSLGVYLLRRALSRAGMALTDVDLVSIDHPELATAYEAGRIDAAVVYDPVRSRLLKQGARLLFDSSEIPGEIVDVMLVRHSVIESRTEDLRALVDGWFRARDLLHDDPQTAASIMIRRPALTRPELLDSLSQVVIPGRQSNRALLASGDSALADALRRLATTMQTLGLLHDPPDVSALLDDRLVKGGHE